jgi:hypothetical protein
MTGADHGRITNPLRALTLVLLCGAYAPLHAQTAATARREAKSSTAPLPQPRPKNLPAAAPPAVAVPPAIAAQPRKAVSNPPRMNPIEMRARIRNCATQWRNMKEKGEDLGKTWGDFSQDCLAKN